MICNNQNYTCEEDTLFLIPPNTRHIFRNFGRETAKNMYVGFSYIFRPEKKLKTDMPIIIRADQPQVRGIIVLLDELSETRREDILATLDQKRLDMMREVVNVFHMILSDDEKFISSNATRTTMLCNKVKEYIMENLNRSIFGRRTGTAVLYLIRLFRTDFPPSYRADREELPQSDSDGVCPAADFRESVFYQQGCIYDGI